MISGRPRHGGVPLPAELSEDVTVVRAMYRAFEESDAPALVRLSDASIRWVHPLVTRLPFDGTRRGLDSVLHGAFHRDERGEGPRVSADTFLEFGDGVLVAGRFLEMGGAEEAGEPFLHECFVRGGRVFLIRGYPAQP